MTVIKRIANTYSKRVKNSIGIAHEFFTLRSSLFTQKLLYVLLNLLEFRRELVEGIFLHHHFYLAQTILIACHLGSCLLGMDGTVADFVLPIIAQSIANALDDGTYYQVEEMMTLYI